MVGMLLGGEISQDEFIDVFLSNINSRSRTSAGIADTSVSKEKLALLLSGEDLRQQMRSNTFQLAEVVYGMATPKKIQTGYSFLSGLLIWNGIINHRISDQRGYRTWNVSYSDQSPAPKDLSLWMETHCARLSSRAQETPNSLDSLASLLAWVDREHDYIGHPWADGCGRISTALVMWFAIRIPGARLPKFRSKKEHYRDISSLEGHTRYFLKCLCDD